MVYTSQVIDAETKAPVPGATVELWYGNLLLASVAANGMGVFTISSASMPDTIKVTSASYKPASYPFAQVIDDSAVVLSKNVVEGENVIITAIKKHKKALGLLALLGLLLLSKKRA